ncbi:MAG: hypothetical protein L0Y72_25090 [Gemmataceae bacterium]|nr:hypothetical protein [Gemmataceae bacterium]MCI0742320.1 hypothetical protein [Gemmataceae bacterium]
MSADSPHDTDRTLHEALSGVWQQIQDGQEPNTEELRARHPHFAEQIEEFAADVSKVRRWTRTLNEQPTQALPPSQPTELRIWNATPLTGQDGEPHR